MDFCGIGLDEDDNIEIIRSNGNYAALTEADWLRKIRLDPNNNSMESYGIDWIKNINVELSMAIKNQRIVLWWGEMTYWKTNDNWRPRHTME